MPRALRPGPWRLLAGAALLAVTGPSAGPADAAGPLWRTERSHGYHVHAIWGSSERNVYAVGETGTILHFDGTRWRELASGTETTLFGVWGASERSVYAMGKGLLLRGSASGWKPVDTGIRERLYAAWGTSERDVFFVGFNGTILHFDGRRFEVQAGKPGAGDGGSGGPWLTGVWGTSPRDVWAVGSRGTILHFDGTRWSPSPSGTTRTLDAVWGASAKSVWAAGEDGTILHWDGSRWSRMESGSDRILTGVWGTPGRTVLATGTLGTILRFGPGSAASAALFGVAAPSRSEAWAVGAKGTVLRLAGESWRPVPSGTVAGLHGVCARGPLVLAVGERGTILRLGEGAAEPMPSPVSWALRDVWCDPNGGALAVGDVGTILRFDGTAWTQMPGATPHHLRGVWGRSATDAWAVGHEGTVLHWNGTAWSRLKNGPVQLHSVHAARDGQVLAVGAWGTIHPVTAATTGRR